MASDTSGTQMHRFNAPRMIDPAPESNGAWVDFQCITAMPFRSYQFKSFEQLRLEDYEIKNRKAWSFSIDSSNERPVKPGRNKGNTSTCSHRSNNTIKNETNNKSFASAVQFPPAKPWTSPSPPALQAAPNTHAWSFPAFGSSNNQGQGQTPNINSFQASAQPSIFTNSANPSLKSSPFTFTPTSNSYTSASLQFPTPSPFTSGIINSSPGFGSPYTFASLQQLQQQPSSPNPTPSPDPDLAKTVYFSPYHELPPLNSARQLYEIKLAEVTIQFKEQAAKKVTEQVAKEQIKKSEVRSYAIPTEKEHVENVKVHMKKLALNVMTRLTEIRRLENQKKLDWGKYTSNYFWNAYGPNGPYRYEPAEPPESYTKSKNQSPVMIQFDVEYEKVKEHVKKEFKTDFEQEARKWRHDNLIQSMDERIENDIKKDCDVRLFADNNDWKKLKVAKGMIDSLYGKRFKDGQLNNGLSNNNNEGGDHSNASNLKSGVILTKAGYYCKPTVQELDKKTLLKDGKPECMVFNFEIGHSEFGKIVYPGVLNVAGINIDKNVLFFNGRVDLWDPKVPVPPHGTGLNNTCIVSLFNMFPSLRVPEPDSQEKSAGEWHTEQAKKYEESLKQDCDKLGATFLKYDSKTGWWTFRERFKMIYKAF